MGPLRNGYESSKGSRLDRLVALAVRQHAVVTTPQVLALGFSKGWIQRAVERRYLHRIYPTVYALGHPRLTQRGRWMAAVLACGPGAALSHHAAAALHDLRRAPWTPIDVTAETGRHHHGIRCHRVRHLDPRDTTVVDGIPVTTVSRVMLDMAEALGAQRLQTLLEASQRAGTFDLVLLDAVVERNPGRHGIKPLAQVLGRLHDEAPWTQSELETRFLELIRAHGLPEPQSNVLVEGELVDFYWADRRVVVEVDGYGFHKTRAAFEADRRRDVRLSLAGILVVRFTYRRIVDEPSAVARELAGLLSPARAERRRGRRGR